MKKARIKDMSFTLYSSKNVWFYGDITNGCLSLTSEVYGEDYNSEKHYTFTKEETMKLFSIISVEDFIEASKKGGTMWLTDFLWKNDIHCDECCI